MTTAQLIQFMKDAEARQIAAINEIKAILNGMDEMVAATTTKIENFVAEENSKRQTAQDRYAAEDFSNAGK